MAYPRVGRELVVWGKPEEGGVKSPIIKSRRDQSILSHIHSEARGFFNLPPPWFLGMYQPWPPQDSPSLIFLRSALFFPSFGPRSSMSPEQKQKQKAKNKKTTVNWMLMDDDPKNALMIMTPDAAQLWRNWMPVSRVCQRRCQFRYLTYLHGFPWSPDSWHLSFSLVTAPSFLLSGFPYSPSPSLRYLSQVSTQSRCRSIRWPACFCLGFAFSSFRSLVSVPHPTAPLNDPHFDVFSLYPSSSNPPISRRRS